MAQQVSKAGYALQQQSFGPVCLRCIVVDGCRGCTLETILEKGTGTICSTPTCHTCKFKNKCGPLPRPGIEGFSVSHFTIIQVALTQPRFAATLALLEKDWASNNDYYAFDLPLVPISANDINHYLYPDTLEAKAYWKEQNTPNTPMLNAPRVIHTVELTPIEGGGVLLTLTASGAPDGPFTKMKITYPVFYQNASHTSIEFE